jgi:hypothetical protein
MLKITAISQEILKIPVAPTGSPEENNTLEKTIVYMFLIKAAMI